MKSGRFRRFRREKKPFVLPAIFGMKAFQEPLKMFKWMFIEAEQKIVFEILVMAKRPHFYSTRMQLLFSRISDIFSVG